MYNSTLSYNDIITNIRETSTKRIKIKRMAISLSLEYRTRLAIAKEEAGEVKAATYIRSLNQIEAVRRLYQNIRVMEKKLKEDQPQKLLLPQKMEVY